MTAVRKILGVFKNNFPSFPVKVLFIFCTTLLQVILTYLSFVVVRSDLLLEHHRSLTIRFNLKRAAAESLVLPFPSIVGIQNKISL